MSLGGDFSSNYTNKIIDHTIQCTIPKPPIINPICISGHSTTMGPVARYPSMLLQSKVCPPPTPAEFALYPKVAVPSSVRTQAIMNKSCATLPDPTQRFSKYQRYQVPVPCAPLTPLAASAGISKPSTRECNIYPRA